MHTCFKEYDVYHNRIYVRYVGTVPRHTVINYCTCNVPYGNVPYNERTLYGPIDAMICSQGDDPMALYFLDKIIICCSFAE